MTDDALENVTTSRTPSFVASPMTTPVMPPDAASIGVTAPAAPVPSSGR